MKNPNKSELQQVSNQSHDIYFKNFIILYNHYTKEPYSFLVNDTNLSSDNTLRLRKKLFKN